MGIRILEGLCRHKICDADLVERRFFYESKDGETIWMAVPRGCRDAVAGVRHRLRRVRHGAAVGGRHPGGLRVVWADPAGHVIAEEAIEDLALASNQPRASVEATARQTAPYPLA